MTYLLLLTSILYISTVAWALGNFPDIVMYTCKLPTRFAQGEYILYVLQAAMHEVFEEDDMRQIFRWLTKFLNNPYSEDDQLVPAGTCIHGCCQHTCLILWFACGSPSS